MGGAGDGSRGGRRGWGGRCRGGGGRGARRGAGERRAVRGRPPAGRDARDHLDAPAHADWRARGGGDVCPNGDANSVAEPDANRDSRAKSDADATPTPEPDGPVLRYDRFDPTGEASTPGSYAFLMPDGDGTRVVETYEELRTESTVMRVHTTDADGVSHAAFYDGVEVGDVVEWRESDDCFVRYTVAEVMTDPTGTVPRKLLAVEWMTYAFTGCSGAIPAGAASAAFTWGPANLQSPHIIVPVRHGPWQLVPGDWAGAIEPQTLAPGRGEIVRPAETFDMAEARRHRLWRDPALPDGWRLYEASVGFEGMDGVTATYVDAAGYLALEIQISQLNVFGVDWGATTIDSQVLIVETRTVDGRPAYVEYSPSDNRIYSTLVRIHDESTGIEYLVIGIAPSLRGRAIDATIEIARSLFESPNPP